MSSFVHKQHESSLTEKHVLQFRHKNLKLYLQIIFWMLPIAILLSPKFATFLLLISILFFLNFRTKYVPNEKIKTKYRNLFMPYSTDMLINTGYEIPFNQFENHMSVVEDTSKLALKEKAMKNVNHLQVGLSKNQMLTHWVVPATTGGGKTVLAKLFLDRVAEIGGGAILVDGKAEAENVFETYNLLASRGRESDIFILNFKTDDSGMPTSHTIKPTQGKSASRAVEFLSDIVANDGGSGGNSDYFEKRGKVMLLPVYAYMSLYEKHFDLDFSISKLQKMTSTKEMGAIVAASYSFLLHVEKKVLKSNSLMKRIKNIEGANITIEFPEMENIEYLLEHISKNPSKRAEIQHELGVNLFLLDDMYFYVFYKIVNYMAGVNERWRDLSVEQAKLVYMDLEDKKFLPGGNSFVDISNVRASIKSLKSFFAENITGDKEGFVLSADADLKVKEAGCELNSIIKIYAEGILDNLDGEKIMQHNYASQQFDYVFQIFSTYKNIFGAETSDVDIVEIMVKNQFLLVLIPTPELESAVVKSLGKIVISFIKLAVANSLGGKELNLTSTQKEIFKATTKPFVIFVIILDEYYSYATKGVALLTAMLRSLQISLVIPVQALDGLKPSDNDTTEKSMILGTTQQYILEVQDEGVIKWVEESIKKERVQHTKKHLDHSDVEISSSEIETHEEFLFDPKDMKRFKNGCSAIVSKGRIYLVQNYYKKAANRPTFIRRYRKFDVA